MVPKYPYQYEHGDDTTGQHRRRNSFRRDQDIAWHGCPPETLEDAEMPFVGHVGGHGAKGHGHDGVYRVAGYDVIDEPKRRAWHLIVAVKRPKEQQEQHRKHQRKDHGFTPAKPQPRLDRCLTEQHRHQSRISEPVRSRKTSSRVALPTRKSDITA